MGCGYLILCFIFIFTVPALGIGMLMLGCLSAIIGKMDNNNKK